MVDAPASTSSLPKSRQKNCNSCVQAKRRCDRQTPTCSRCREKGTICIYGRTTAISQPDQEDSELPNPFMRSSAFESPVYSPFVAEQLQDSDDFRGMPTEVRLGAINSTHEPMQDYQIDVLVHSDFPMDSFMDMMDAPLESAPDRWLVPIEKEPMFERLSSPATEEITRTYDKMSDLCDHTEAWNLYDSRTPLHYVVNRVKQFTTDIATSNATPFLHRYLYRDHTPHCILSCFSSSVLYANRTQENAAMVMRALHNNSRELVNTEAHRVTATPVEKLARTQALFLYQVVRLLDGNVTLRAQGEKDIPLLKRWVDELCSVRDNLGDVAHLGCNMMKKQTPRGWEKWIFAESLRRTVVITYSFMTLYELMKDPENKDNQEPWDYVHRWTLSRHLWDADSPSKFARMWKDKSQFIITNYSFEDFLEYGRGDDVDEFAKILLSCFMGVDETIEFTSTNNAID